MPGGKVATEKTANKINHFTNIVTLRTFPGTRGHNNFKIYLSMTNTLLRKASAHGTSAE